MLEGRLREGFVRIRQLMVGLSFPVPSYQLMSQGTHTPRNPSPRPIQPSPLLRPH